MKTLAFDLDGKNGFNVFLQRKWIMKYLGLKVGKPNLGLYHSEDPQIAERYKNIPETPVRVWHTTNGWHLEIDNLKAVLMQTLLGSDYRREICLLLRIERGCKDWNNFYRQKFVSLEKFDTDFSQKVLDLLELGQ